MTPDPSPTAGVPGAWGPPPPAPMPGVIPLRPLSIVEIFDGALATVRLHPRATLLPAFVVSATIGVLGLAAALVTLNATEDLAALDPAEVDPGDAIAALAPTLVAGISVSVLQLMGVVLLAGFVTAVVGDAVLGRRVTLATTWTRVRPLIGPLVGLTALMTLILLPLALAFVLPAVWVGVGLSLATAVRVLEGGGSGRSLRRSWQLVEGTWWRTFGSLVLAGVIVAAVTAVVAVPFAIPELVAPSVDPESFAVDRTRLLVNTSIATVGRVLAGTLTLPFGSAVLALIYLDRRMRREGLHVTLASASET